MAATRHNGTARKPSAVPYPITSPPGIRPLATLATSPPLGLAPLSITRITPFPITVLSATIATRSPRTTPASPASTATPRLHTSRFPPPTSTTALAISSTAPPPATTATKMAAVAEMRSTPQFGLLFLLFAILLFAALPSLLKAQSPAPNIPAQKPSVFHVKYVSEGSLYIDAGRNADLQEGMKLSVIDLPPDGMVNDGIRFRGYPHVAELNLVSLADSSAVCDVISSKSELKEGQLAFLTPGSVEERHLAENAREAEDYPILVSFTSGDPVEQELRSAKVQDPSLVESPLGVMRARVGFGYGAINESGMNSTQMNMMIDADMSHIGGTYWNFNGYWRGNYNTSSSSTPGASTQTLTDLINRTYQIGFTYNSPYSPNVVGVGRLFLPWAPSLSTIDGGYYGRRFDNFFTAGVFGGSTPDPASWSYNPDQQIAGTFLSMERGDFDSFHIVSTAGLAMTSIHWRVARQFAFFENNFSWKRYLSFYSSLQVDEARTSPLPGGGSNPSGISQTFNSAHFQPIKLVTFGVNYNYFRTLPTFDPKL